MIKSARTLLKRLELTCPIFQAPMAGGPTTPELVSAVSNAGGLGALAGGLLSPTVLRDRVTQIRQQTTKPFNINLFVINQPVCVPAQLEKAGRD